MDRIVCQMCGEEFNSITHKHLKRHDMTTQEYLATFDLTYNDIISDNQREARRINALKNVSMMNKINKDMASKGKRWMQTKKGRQHCSDNMKNRWEVDYDKNYVVSCKNTKKMNKAHKKLIKSGKAYIQSDKFKVINSKRMKINNPMFDKDVAKQVSETLREKYKHEIHPNTGNKRPDFSKWLKENNPIWDPVHSAKIKETLLRQGNISKGQDLLYKIMDGIAKTTHNQITYNKEYKVDHYFLDVAVPSLRVGIEYDGHFSHYLDDGMKDVFRDYELNIYGWRILRIDNNYIFKNEVVNDIWQFINYSTEVRKCLGKKYNQLNI